MLPRSTLVRPGEEARTESFLSGPAARLAGKWKFARSKKSRTLAVAVALVAAIAGEQHCQLLTNNRKDSPIAEVKLYLLPCIRISSKLV